MSNPRKHCVGDFISKSSVEAVIYHDKLYLIPRRNDTVFAASGT
jgi:hypothetical protein